MEVFYGFDNLRKFHGAVVTVGSYDGVHRGHRELLQQIVDTARNNGGESVVITFSPHPRQVIEGISPKLLNSLDEKIVLLEQVGIDNLIVAPFTRQFSRLTPEQFVSDYLVGKVGMRSLVVGYNHHFGRGNKGDFNTLIGLKQKYGFETFEVSQKCVDNDKVSSTIVREVVSNGDMRRAESYLGYPYFIMCALDAQGRVEVDREAKLLPPAGVYAVRVCQASDFAASIDGELIIGDQLHLSIANPDIVNQSDRITIFF